MKQISFVLLVGLSLIACSKGKIEAGSSVAAKWHNMWYLAEVKSVDGNQYNVQYGDGTNGKVGAGDIKPIPANPKLNEGDKVWAAWQGARLYLGTVKSIETDGYLIEWDDGSTPSKVARGKLLKQ